MAEREPTQKILMLFAMMGFIALLVFPAFDHRFGWSPVPSYVSLAADALGSQVTAPRRGGLRPRSGLGGTSPSTGQVRNWAMNASNIQRAIHANSAPSFSETAKKYWKREPQRRAFVRASGPSDCQPVNP
jgi:hypothetical protein